MHNPIVGSTGYLLIQSRQYNRFPHFDINNSVPSFENSTFICVCQVIPAPDVALLKFQRMSYIYIRTCKQCTHKLAKLHVGQQ